MENVQTVLESRFAELIRVVEDLSDVVARQDRDIVQLQTRVQMLMEREAARVAEACGGVVLGDERPPHY